MEVKVYHHQMKQPERNYIGGKTQPLDVGQLDFAQLATQVSGAKV